MLSIKLVLPVAVLLLMAGIAMLSRNTADGHGTGASQPPGAGPLRPPPPAADHGPVKRIPSAMDVPYRVSGGQLVFTVNRTEPDAELRHYTAATVTSDGKLVLPSGVKRIVVEVGTNDEPELTSVVEGDRETLIVAFEPRPDAFAAMRAKFPAKLKDRIIALPAAVADRRTAPTGFVQINVGGHRGCSSLLSQSKSLHHYAMRQKQKARKKSQATQLRTIEWCAMTDGTFEVPAMSLAALFDLLPPSVPVHLLMTDAQGFDTNVASTLPVAAARRIPFLVLECQDLAVQDRNMMLVDGAPTCAEQRSCVEQWFPHVLEGCWDNAPKVREMNCIYRNDEAVGSANPTDPFAAWPKKLKAPPRDLLSNLSYAGRAVYTCPAHIDQSTTTGARHAPS